MIIPHHALVRSLALLLILGTAVLGQPALDSFNPNLNGTLRTIVVQPDGKILIGGEFLTVGGTIRPHIARLHADGSLDTNFVGSAPKAIHAIALQADGKILAAGNFPLFRLHTNGAPDTSFFSTNSGSVLKIQALPDDRALVLYQGLRGLVRHQANGTQDGSFLDGSGWSSLDFQRQTDDRIIIVGNGGTPTNAIRRLHPDGSRDTSFAASAALPTNLIEQTYVSGLILQADGRMLVGGSFSNLSGQARPGFGRLNPEGSLDGSFIPDSQAFGGADILAPQANGKIIAAHPTGGLRRYRSGGARDTGFHFAVNNVRVMAVQPDGGILIGGDFTTVNGTNRNRLARILPGEPLAPPPLPAPRFLEFTEHPGGLFRFSATNLEPAGVPFQVLAATNITQPWWSWVSLGQPAPGTNGYQFQFIDPVVATNAPRRFYQLRLDP